MNNSESTNNNKLNEKLNCNGNEQNKTIPLFENDNFEINQSEDEYVSIDDDEIDENEISDEENEISDEENEISDEENAKFDDAISEDNMNGDDYINNDHITNDNDDNYYKKKKNIYYNENKDLLKTRRREKQGNEEVYFKEGEEEINEDKNINEIKESNINIISLKKRMKRKYINKNEKIYYDEIGIYKNNKIMKNEDIEDRMKYLLLLLSNAKKNNIKLEKSAIIKELLFYYSYYYEYSKEMIKYLNYLFDVKELYLFLELNNMPKEIHLRTNTLKTTRSNLIKILKSQNIAAAEGDKWNNVGIIVNDLNSNVGSLNEYLYGYYMIQSSSSFIPVLELNIQENDLALDLCAAPGGKCTFMCAIKKNKGVVYANDINKFRCKAIEAHASRMGINNLIVTCMDALKIHKHLTFQFDKILLDAPCSGTGVVNKNKGARRKTIKEIRELAQKQRKLLNNAINLLKNGGIIVYSTCSITIEENEQVINYILKKRDVNLLPLDINIGEPGITHYKKKQFSSKISLCRRIYLHKHNHDNFFVAKLIKRSNSIFDKNKDIINKKEKKKTKKDNIEVINHNEKNNKSIIKEKNSLQHKKNKTKNNKINKHKKVKEHIQLNKKKKGKCSIIFNDKKRERNNNQPNYEKEDRNNSQLIYEKKDRDNSQPNDKKKKNTNIKIKHKKYVKNETHNKNTKNGKKNGSLNESKYSTSKKGIKKNDNKKNNNKKNNLSINNRKIKKDISKNKKVKN